jgi:hypothetical protein
VQSPEPPIELKPGAHAAQAVAPGSPLKVSTAHRRHGVDPSASWSYRPAAQGAQVLAPSGANEPAAQRPMQTVAALPVAAWLSSKNRPAAQGTQGVAAFTSWST